MKLANIDKDGLAGSIRKVTREGADSGGIEAMGRS